MPDWGSARIEILLEWLSGSLLRTQLESCAFPSALYSCRARRVADPAALHSTFCGFDPPVARSFGLSYRKQLSVVLLLSCALAASAVGAVGPIIFVGLVVPHLARFLAGKRFALVLPFTVALGAFIVTSGHLLGRLLGQAEEIPIGVVTAVFGVPGIDRPASQDTLRIIMPLSCSQLSVFYGSRKALNSFNYST